MPWFRRKSPESAPPQRKTHRVPKPVQFYVTTSRTHLGTMDRIENREEWAILYDTVDNRWEVWIDGELQLYDGKSREEALAMMQQYLDDPWWDYRQRDGTVVIPAKWRT